MCTYPMYLIIPSYVIVLDANSHIFLNKIYYTTKTKFINHDFNYYDFTPMEK